MTDKEFLELAAKAVGYQFSWSDGYDCGEIWQDGDKKKRFWQPHRDDGDAFRLAVKLKLQIEHTEFAVHISPFGDNEDYIVSESVAASIPKDLAMSRATRRAIVRAAAEIGKNM